MTAAPTLPLPTRIQFPGLDSAAFEHPADRAALEALRRAPGLDKLLRVISEYTSERFLRIYFLGDSLRVSPRQCGRLYSDLREACSILDVEEPEIYLRQNPVPNAFTFGMKRYTIVATTGLVDLLTDTERLSVIGHELGHIKAQHMLYRTMAMIFERVISSIAGGLNPLGFVVNTALLFALYDWFRKSELTADRAGLLTVQDPEACVSSLMKLVGGSRRFVDDLSVDEFVKQADVYEDMDESLLGLLYKLQLVGLQSHPYPAVRSREIKEWAESEQYGRLLRGDYPRTGAGSGVRTCPTCGAGITNVTFRFCTECGAQFDPVV